MKSFVRELGRHNPGLCVLTSRLPTTDLKDFSGRTVRDIDLKNLSPAAGMELLKSLGVRGDEVELKRTSEEFDGHALALTLLGRYLAVVYDGAINERDKIPSILSERTEGGHAKRVMESYEKWFAGKPELNILYLVGLFDRPADFQALEVLKASPAIQGLTSDLEGISYEDWRYAVHNLCDLWLLAKDTHNQGAVDSHPLIREYFGLKLKTESPDAWKRANSRLFDHYRATAEEFPNTNEEMTPLYWAIVHGCRSGRFEEALHDVYRTRVRRGSELFNIYKLNTFGADLSALNSFLDESRELPVSDLSEDDKGFVMSAIGFDLRALGRLSDAIPATIASLDSSIKQRDWLGAGIESRNLSQLHLLCGNLESAIRTAEEAVKFADDSGNPHEQMVERVTLGEALHYSGDLTTAESVFFEAEAIQKTQITEPSQLYSLGNFRYCDLLLSQGNYREVQSRSTRVLLQAEYEKDLLDMALGHLCLGWALSYDTSLKGQGLEQAGDHITAAIGVARQAGRQDFLPRCLIAYARVLRLQENFGKAKEALLEGDSLAESGKMVLFQADAYLEYAWLGLTTQDIRQVNEPLERARNIIEKSGYLRQQINLILAYAWFFLAQHDRANANECLREAQELLRSGWWGWASPIRSLESTLNGWNLTDS